MNYILKYKKKMIKGKGKKKNIVTRDKCKVNTSVPLLILLKSKNQIPLLHVSLKTIKKVEIDKIIHQFHVGYMSFPFSKKKDIQRIS